MSSSPVKEIKRDLIERGIPSQYVERVTAELTDHYETLVERYRDQGHSIDEVERRASQTLGKPDQLSDQIADRLHDSTWISRHPVVSFFITPLLSLFLAVPLMWLGQTFLLELMELFRIVLGTKPGSLTPIYSGLEQLFQFVILFVIPSGLAVIFYWLSRHYFRGHRGGLTAGILVTLTNMIFYIGDLETLYGAQQEIWLSLTKTNPLIVGLMGMLLGRGPIYFGDQVKGFGVLNPTSHNLVMNLRQSPIRLLLPAICIFIVYTVYRRRQTQSLAEFA